MSVDKSQIFTLLFFAISLLHVAGIVANVKWLQIIFKPLIILSLIAVYVQTVEKVNKWYLTALIFSFFGDILLMKEQYFLFGIGAFLITQTMFVKIIVGQLNKIKTHLLIYASVPFVIYLISLLLVLRPNLGEYFIPVVVYGTVISIFGTVSLLNYLLHRKKRGSTLLLIGAVLFVISDSMIAINKFYEPHDSYAVAIMITYIMAQYLIFNFMMETKFSRNLSA